MQNNTARPLIDEHMNNKAARPFGMRDKIGYMFGDFGNDFFFMLTSAFLMVFYTEVFGLSAAAVGTLFLIARLWDALADVTVGVSLIHGKQQKMVNLNLGFSECPSRSLFQEF